MQRVVVESPFGKTVRGEPVTPFELARNIKYAQRCMADCLRRGEAPYASHLLYPQVLDDNQAAQREQGIKAGFAWGLAADYVAVYLDYGSTPGMEQGIARAHFANQRVDFRRIGRNPYSTPYVAKALPATSIEDYEVK